MPKKKTSSMKVSFAGSTKARKLRRRLSGPTVDVTVSATPQGITAAVSPWQCTVASDEDIQWNSYGDVAGLEILRVGAAKDWPFPDVPPTQESSANKYRGRRPKSPRPRKSGFPRGTIVPYAIVVTFADPNGGPDRKLVIDPDMVMDT